MSLNEAFFFGVFVGGILAAIVIAVWSLIESAKRDREDESSMLKRVNRHSDEDLDRKALEEHWHG